MFDNPAAGESAGIMSMIPALLQNKGLDPNMVAALMSNKNNQDAWGGAGCWWIWIILLFFLWGGNGFGNGFGNGANGIPAQLNNEAGRELLMNAIQGNGTAINQLASSLNCSTQQLQNAICQIQGQIQQVGNQVGLSSQQIINSIQSNSAAIGSQLASCCCDIRTAIERQGCDSRLATVEQTNTLTSNANTQFNILGAKIDAQTAIINDKFCQLEMREMQNKFVILIDSNVLSCNIAGSQYFCIILTKSDENTATARRIPTSSVWTEEFYSIPQKHHTGCFLEDDVLKLIAVTSVKK